jgi:hypothetical protein
MKRRPCHVKKRQYFAYSALSLSGRKLDKMLNFFLGGGGQKEKVGFEHYHVDFKIILLSIFKVSF